MKNIFKMMGIALLACSMIMVSCKKDDDSTNEGGQGGQGGQGGGGTTPTATVNVKFDNQTVNLPIHDGYYFNLGAENTQLAGLEAFTFIGATGATSEEYELPMVKSNVMRYNGTYTIAEQLSLGSYFPSVAYVDETEDVWYIQKLNANPVFGNFDATNHTFSFTYDVQLYNYEEWISAMRTLMENGGYSEEDLENIPGLYEELSAQADEQTTMKDCYVKVENVVFTPSIYFAE